MNKNIELSVSGMKNVMLNLHSFLSNSLFFLKEKKKKGILLPIDQLNCIHWVNISSIKICFSRLSNEFKKRKISIRRDKSVNHYLKVHQHLHKLLGLILSDVKPALLNKSILTLDFLTANFLHLYKQFGFNVILQ